MENVKAIKVFQVLKDGALLWKNNFFSFSKVYLVIYVPLAVAHLWFLMIRQGTSASRADWPGFLFALIILVWGIWMEITLILTAKKADAGEKIVILQNAGGAFKYFLPYLGTVLLLFLLILGFTFVGVGGGFGLGGLTAFLYERLHGAAQIASLIIGIAATVVLAIAAVCYSVYFGIRLSLGSYACVLETKGTLAALKRSFALVKNQVNPVVGVFVVLILAAIGFYLLPAVLLVALMENTKEVVNIAGTICQYGVGLVFIPASKAVVFKLYQQLQGLLGDAQ